MAKNWRLAVCTRWRPLVCLLLGLGLVSCTLAVTFLTEEIGPSFYDKAQTLTVGMSEQEMIKIMGKRFYAETVKTGQIVSRLPNPTQAYNDLLSSYEQVIEYSFCEKRKFGYRSVLEVGGIYLDEASRRIVFVQPNWGILELSGIQFLFESLLLLAGCFAVPLIGLHLWCKRQQKRFRAVGEDFKSL